MKRFILLVVVLFAPCFACAEDAPETFTVATYNVEFFHSHFSAFHYTHGEKAPFDVTTEEGKHLLADLKEQNDKANWGNGAGDSRP